MAEKLCALRKRGRGELKETVLWTNSAPSSDFLSQNITLNDSIDNYDDIVFKYKASTTSTDIGTIVVSVADLKKSTTVTAIDNPYVGLTMRLSNGLYQTRLVAYISVTELSISTSYQLYGAVLSNSYAIPTQVLGRKY